MNYLTIFVLRTRFAAAVAVAAMAFGWASLPVLAATASAVLLSMGAAAAVSGALYLDRRPRPFDRIPGTRLRPADRRHLWDMVVSLSGVPDPAPEG